MSKEEQQWNTVFQKYHRVEKELVKIINTAQKSNDQTVEKLNAVIKDNKNFECEILFMNREMSKIVDKLKRECNSLNGIKKLERGFKHLNKYLNGDKDTSTCSKENRKYLLEHHRYSDTFTAGSVKSVESYEEVVKSKSEKLGDEALYEQLRKQLQILRNHEDVSREIEEKQEQIFHAINWAYREIKKYESYAGSCDNEKVIQINKQQESKKLPYRGPDETGRLEKKKIDAAMKKNKHCKGIIPQNVRDHTHGVLDQLNSIHQSLEVELTELKDMKNVSGKLNDSSNRVFETYYQTSITNRPGGIFIETPSDESTVTFKEFMKGVLTKLTLMYHNLTNEYEYCVRQVNKETSSRTYKNFERSEAAANYWRNMKNSKKELLNKLKSTCDIMKKVFLSVTDKLIDKNVIEAFEEGVNEEKLIRTNVSIQKMVKNLTYAYENMKNETRKVKCGIPNEDVTSKRETSSASKKSEHDVLEQLRITYENMKRVYEDNVQKLQRRNDQTKTQDAKSTRNNIKPVVEPKTEKIKGKPTDAESTEPEENKLTATEDVNNLGYSKRGEAQVNTLTLYNETKGEILNRLNSTYENMKSECNNLQKQIVHKDFQIDSNDGCIKTDITNQGDKNSVETSKSTGGLNNAQENTALPVKDILKRLNFMYNNIKTEYKCIEDKLTDKSVEEEIFQKEQEARYLEKIRQSKKNVLQTLKFAYEAIQNDSDHNCFDKNLQNNIAPQKNTKDSNSLLIDLLVHHMQTSKNTKRSKKNLTLKPKSYKRLQWFKPQPMRSKCQPSRQNLCHSSNQNEDRVEIETRSSNRNEDPEEIKTDSAATIETQRSKENHSTSTLKLSYGTAKYKRLHRDKKSKGAASWVDTEERKDAKNINQDKTLKSRKTNVRQNKKTTISINNTKEINRLKLKLKQEDIKLKANTCLKFIQSNPAIKSVSVNIENVDQNKLNKDILNKNPDTEENNQFCVHLSSTYDSLKDEWNRLTANKSSTIQEKVSNIGGDINNLEAFIRKEEGQVKVPGYKQSSKVVKELKFVYNDLKEKYIYGVIHEEDELKKEIAEFERIKAKIEDNMKRLDKKLTTIKFKKSLSKLVLKRAYTNLRTKYNDHVATTQTKLQEKIAKFINTRKKMEEEIHILEQHIKEFKLNRKNKCGILTQTKNKLLKDLELKYDILQGQYQYLINQKANTLHKDLSYFANEKKKIEKHFIGIERKMKEFKLNADNFHVIIRLQLSYISSKNEFTKFINEKEEKLQKKISYYETKRREMEKNMNIVDVKIRELNIDDFDKIIIDKNHSTNELANSENSAVIEKLTINDIETKKISMESTAKQTSKDNISSAYDNKFDDREISQGLIPTNSHKVRTNTEPKKINEDLIKINSNSEHTNKEKISKEITNPSDDGEISQEIIATKKHRARNNDGPEKKSKHVIKSNSYLKHINAEKLSREISDPTHDVQTPQERIAINLHKVRNDDGSEEKSKHLIKINRCLKHINTEKISKELLKPPHDVEISQQLIATNVHKVSKNGNEPEKKSEHLMKSYSCLKHKNEEKISEELSNPSHGVNISQELIATNVHKVRNNDEKKSKHLIKINRCLKHINAEKISNPPHDEEISQQLIATNVHKIHNNDEPEEKSKHLIKKKSCLKHKHAEKISKELLKPPHDVEISQQLIATNVHKVSKNGNEPEKKSEHLMKSYSCLKHKNKEKISEELSNPSHGVNISQELIATNVHKVRNNDEKKSKHLIKINRCLKHINAEKISKELSNPPYDEEISQQLIATNVHKIHNNDEPEEKSKHLIKKKSCLKHKHAEKISKEIFNPSRDVEISQELIATSLHKLRNNDGPEKKSKHSIKINSCLKHMNAEKILKDISNLSHDVEISQELIATNLHKVRNNDGPEENLIKINSCSEYINAKKKSKEVLNPKIEPLIKINSCLELINAEKLTNLHKVRIDEEVKEENEDLIKMNSNSEHKNAKKVLIDLEQLDILKELISSYENMLVKDKRKKINADDITAQQSVVEGSQIVTVNINTNKENNPEKVFPANEVEEDGKEKDFVTTENKEAFFDMLFQNVEKTICTKPNESKSKISEIITEGETSNTTEDKLKTNDQQYNKFAPATMRVQEDKSYGYNLRRATEKIIKNAEEHLSIWRENLHKDKVSYIEGILKNGQEKLEKLDQFLLRSKENSLVRTFNENIIQSNDKIIIPAVEKLQDVQDEDKIIKNAEKQLEELEENIQNEKIEHADGITKNEKLKESNLNKIKIYDEAITKAEKQLGRLKEKVKNHEKALQAKENLVNLEKLSMDAKETEKNLIKEYTLQELERITLKGIILEHPDISPKEKRKFKKRIKNIHKMKTILKYKLDKYETTDKPPVGEKNKRNDSGDKSRDAGLKIVNLPSQNVYGYKFNPIYINKEDCINKIDNEIFIFNEYHDTKLKKITSPNDSNKMDLKRQIDEQSSSKNKLNDDSMELKDICKVNGLLNDEKDMLQQLKQELLKRLISIVKIKKILKANINENDAVDNDHSKNEQYSHVEHINETHKAREEFKRLANKTKMNNNRMQDEVMNVEKMNNLLETEKGVFYELKQALMRKVGNIDKIEGLLKKIVDEENSEEITKRDIMVLNPAWRVSETFKQIRKLDSGDKSTSCRQTELKLVTLPGQNIEPTVKREQIKETRDNVKIRTYQKTSTSDNAELETQTNKKTTQMREYEVLLDVLNLQDPTLVYNVVLDGKKDKNKNVPKTKNTLTQMLAASKRDGIQAEDNLEGMKNQIVHAKELISELQEITLKTDGIHSLIFDDKKIETSRKGSDEIQKLIEEIRELKQQGNNKKQCYNNKELSRSADQTRTSCEILKSHIEGDKLNEYRVKNEKTTLAKKIQDIEMKYKQYRHLQDLTINAQGEQFEILKKNLELEVQLKMLEYTVKSLEAEVEIADTEAKSFKKLIEFPNENIKCLEITDENVREVLKDLTVEEIYQIKKYIKELDKTLKENAFIIKTIIRNNKTNRNNVDPKKSNPFNTQRKQDPLIIKLKREIEELKLEGFRRRTMLKEQELKLKIFKKETKKREGEISNTDSEEIRIVEYYRADEHNQRGTSDKRIRTNNDKTHKPISNKEIDWTLIEEYNLQRRMPGSIMQGLPIGKNSKETEREILLDTIQRAKEASKDITNLSIPTESKNNIVKRKSDEKGDETKIISSNRIITGSKSISKLNDFSGEDESVTEINCDLKVDEELYASTKKEINRNKRSVTDFLNDQFVVKEGKKMSGTSNESVGMKRDNDMGKETTNEDIKSLGMEEFYLNEGKIMLKDEVSLSLWEKVIGQEIEDTPNQDEDSLDSEELKIQYPEDDTYSHYLKNLKDQLNELTYVQNKTKFEDEPKICADENVNTKKENCEIKTMGGSSAEEIVKLNRIMDSNSSKEIIMLDDISADLVDILDFTDSPIETISDSDSDL